MSTLRISLLSRTFLFLGCGALLTSCAGRTTMPAGAFEGTITQTIHLKGLGSMMHPKSDSAGAASDSTTPSSPASGMLANGITVEMKIFVREDKVAYQIEALAGLLNVRAIINRSTRTLTMLYPGRQAVVTNLRSFDTIREKIDDSLRAHQGAVDSFAAMLPQPTGKKATINGFETEEYRGKVRGMDIDLWLTSDPRMKFYDVVRDAFLGRSRTGTGGIEELFNIIAPVSGGKVPVKTEISQNGKVLISSELGTIEEKKLDDDLFEIPKNYEITHQDSIPATTKEHPRRGYTAPLQDSGSAKGSAKD